MAAKKKKTQKPAWERGYQGHVLWAGKQKLGRVNVHAGSDAGQKYSGHKYTWEAAGRTGEADSLDKARAAVEYAVMVADKQRDLFE
ncbi:MAG: hypothetical protein AB7O31_03480 [Burkholderiales bacterium]